MESRRRTAWKDVLKQTYIYIYQLVSWVSWLVNHDDVTNRPIMDTFSMNFTTQLTTQHNICCTSGCQLQLLYCWWWVRKLPKFVEWSCNKIKILVLHLCGHFTRARVCVYSIKAKPFVRNSKKKLLYQSMDCVIHMTSYQLIQTAMQWTLYGHLLGQAISR
jgi:hypothetical protein